MQYQVRIYTYTVPGLPVISNTSPSKEIGQCNAGLSDIPGGYSYVLHAIVVTVLEIVIYLGTRYASSPQLPANVDTTTTAYVQKNKTRHETKVHSLVIVFAHVFNVVVCSLFAAR